MTVHLIASFAEPAGKNHAKPHTLNIHEATPLIACMTLERFLEKFTPKCYNLKVSMESSK